MAFSGNQSNYTPNIISLLKDYQKHGIEDLSNMNMKNLTIVSLFSGAGGLDLGFKRAGFTIVYANDYDKTVWETFAYNFKETQLDTRDLRTIKSSEIPDSIGIIGGPPCQSWSEAGALRGIDDARGRLFLDYIRVIREKKPLFFVVENVAGMLHERNKKAFNQIINSFNEIGYHLHFKLLNAQDYNVPQDRKRVFIIGFLHDIDFQFPQSNKKRLTLKETIFDLKDSAKIYDRHKLDGFNHEYYTAGFSPIFMSRNRVRSWQEQSFTIQAGGRHVPLHPQAPQMAWIGKDKRAFQRGKEHLYRRLSVRECARIQTFPDEFRFIYTNILAGYKMVGNAVPVNFSYEIARQLLIYLL